MRIDMHTHTAEYSGCSVISGVDLLQTARDNGLDAVVITDHVHHLTGDDRDRLQQAVPEVRVFRGVEISIGGTTWEQIGVDDILLICTDKAAEQLDGLRDQEIDRLVEFARQADALTILAHPFRFNEQLAFDIERFRPDAVEVASGNMSPSVRRRARELAQQNDLPMVANSDAHNHEPIGMYYVDVPYDVHTEAELARAIRNGDFRIGVDDEYADL